jgi:hypothetical protein
MTSPQSVSIVRRVGASAQDAGAVFALLLILLPIVVFMSVVLAAITYEDGLDEVTVGQA